MIEPHRDATQGYTGHRPGRSNNYGVSAATQEKLSHLYVEADVRVDLDSNQKRDAWGDFRETNDLLPTLATIYKSTFRNADQSAADRDAGTVAEQSKAAEARDAELAAKLPPGSYFRDHQHPIPQHIPPAAPPHVSGFGGHRPQSQFAVGETFHATECFAHKEYAENPAGTYNSVAGLTTTTTASPRTVAVPTATGRR
eukprot:TRINITY_DN3911_c0_g2_i1.p1 TRINITY_DN3911_c0_g2~~TRINITY_DN3911_c0_g2_i1.p1  ORF type:complete len:221 (+),score=24.46 TRINITY_DN3911_c0_g2_i1:70-663(+)